MITTWAPLASRLCCTRSARPSARVMLAVSGGAVSQGWPAVATVAAAIASAPTSAPSSSGAAHCDTRWLYDSVRPISLGMNAITWPAVLSTMPVAIDGDDDDGAHRHGGRADHACRRSGCCPSRRRRRSRRTRPCLRALASTPVTTIEPTPATSTTGSATEIATGTSEASLSSLDDDRACARGAGWPGPRQGQRRGSGVRGQRGVPCGSIRSGEAAMVRSRRRAGQRDCDECSRVAS